MAKTKAAPQRELVHDEPEVNCIFSKMVAIEKVKPNPDNPNIHPEEQIKVLAGVLRAHGWREAIIVSNRSGMVVKGHGRLQTAKALKIKRVPVEFQDNVDQQAEYADMIADNRVAQHSYVDALKLGTILKKISAKGQESLGYAQEEIDLYLAAEYVAPKETSAKFLVLESLKMSKEAKAIVGRAVQRYCLRIGKEVEWGEALASICIEWEGGSSAGHMPAPKAEPEPKAKGKAAKAKAKPPVADDAKARLAAMHADDDAPLAPQALKDLRIFKVDYVAGCLVGGEDAFVIRPKESAQGFYTTDPAIVKVARLAEVCSPLYDLKGEVVSKGKQLWLVALEKA